MSLFLHFYRCRICGTTASGPLKLDTYTPLRCNLCRSYMQRLYAEPVVTPEHAALAARGLVYNQTTSKVLNG